MFRINSRIQGIAATSLLCVITLAACGDSGSGGKSNADLLKEAAANMKTATSYHMDANIEQGGTPVKLVGDIDVARDILGREKDYVVSPHQPRLPT